MTQLRDSQDRLLNVGCGRCYHPDWTNVDLVANSHEVQQCDLRRGIPFDDNHFDAVYHSHVLEHLNPADARSMLTECRRVLREGGVLRVVVPDLEGIARAYVQSISEAESGDELALANHRWMTLEMIDQLARQRGGGEMGRLMNDADLPNLDFVRSRIGGEMGPHKNAKARKSFSQRISRVLADVRKGLALAAVSLIDGAAGRAAYREGRFRQSGEIHRWMYDRISLRNLLHEVGFGEVRVCAADESRIANFDGFQLDRDGKQPRKPDSLYVEAIKVATVAIAKSDQTPAASADRAA